MFPQIENQLPNLMPFVELLAQEYQTGTLDTWETASQWVKDFFTAEVMAQFESVVPGWGKMTSYQDGVTLTHVMCVFTALVLCPEYQRATGDQQAILKWAVLFHDLAKEPARGQRDHTHGFRSAALTGRILPRLGFPLLNANGERLETWAKLAETALSLHPEMQQVQDNQKLPEILAGLQTLFGENTAAALILKTVLLHMSIDVLTEWPQAAPLTEAEAIRYVDTTLLPLLEIMMVVDNDAWAFFDPATKARHRAETLAVFSKLRNTSDA